jgi:hypothetical protein
MRWAQHSSNPTVAADYLSMSQQSGTWYRNYGWDYTNSKGTFYGSVTQVCNPASMVFNPALVANNLVSTLHGGDGGSVQGCGAVGSIQPNGGSNAVARVQNAEGGNAMAQWYYTNPSANQSTVDTFYGAMFGSSQVYGANAGCSISVASTCDGIDAINCEFSGMNGYKWPGFCFGMGGFFSTSYPAIRTSMQHSNFYNPVPMSGTGIRGLGLAP